MLLTCLTYHWSALDEAGDRLQAPVIRDDGEVGADEPRTSGGFRWARSCLFTHGKSETYSLGELASRANESARCVKIKLGFSFRLPLLLPSSTSPRSLFRGGLRDTPKRSIVIPDDGPNHSSPRPSLPRSVVTPPRRSLEPRTRFNSQSQRSHSTQP